MSEALDRVDGIPNVQLTRAFHPLPAVSVDREQIQNVVTNLVLNAQDALGLDGRIEVRTEQRDGRVLLSVTDNGCGMDQAFVKDSLFRPFQSTKKKGLGIGLFQSRAIVQAHGGAIHVQSEVGRGTTFLVSLPVASREMTKTTLLIVEDDEDIRTQMKWALAADYDVADGRRPCWSGDCFHGQPPHGDDARSGPAAAPE